MHKKGEGGVGDCSGFISLDGGEGNAGGVGVV